MEQRETDIRRYLWLLWRGKWLILLTTVVALGGAGAFTKQEPPPIPRYRATTTIMVEGGPSLAMGANFLATATGDGDRAVNTRIMLMTSRNVMERALRKLQPTQEAEPPSA